MDNASESQVLSCEWAGCMLILDSDRVTATNGDLIWHSSADSQLTSGITTLKLSLTAPADSQRIVACIDAGDDLSEEQLRSSQHSLSSCQELWLAVQKLVTSDAGQVWVDLFRCKLQRTVDGMMSAVLQPLLHEAAAARSRQQRLQQRLLAAQAQLREAQQRLLGEQPSQQLKLGLASLVEHLRIQAQQRQDNQEQFRAEDRTQERSADMEKADLFGDGASTASDASSSSDSSTGAPSPRSAASQSTGMAPTSSQPFNGTIPLSTLELSDSEQAKEPVVPSSRKVSLLSLVGAAAASSSSASAQSGSTALRNAPKRRRRR